MSRTTGWRRLCGRYGSDGRGKAQGDRLLPALQGNVPALLERNLKHAREASAHLRTHKSLQQTSGGGSSAPSRAP